MKNKMRIGNPKVAPKAASGMNIKTQRVSGAQDVRYEPLYDTTSLSGATTTISKRLFTTPIGGSVTKNETNMTLNGILPSPQSMVVKGIRAEAIVRSGADYALLTKLLRGTYISFFVGTKAYLEVPLSYIAGKHFLQMEGSIDDGTAKRFSMHLGEGSENGLLFADNKVIKIAPQENFYLDWTGAISHTPAVATLIRFYLEGIRYVDVR